MVSFTRQEVQQAVWNLGSPFLEHATLKEALQSMCRLMTSGTSPIEIRSSGTELPLEHSTRHHLLRIVQEAVTNALRHSGSDRVVIELSCTEDAFALEVRDFGRGFVPEEVFQSGPDHFGLRGMRARAAKMEAEFSVKSAPGHGTSVRVCLSPHPNNDSAREGAR
jgi:signal transduction histidine kinase